MPQVLIWSRMIISCPGEREGLMPPAALVIRIFLTPMRRISSTGITTGPQPAPSYQCRRPMNAQTLLPCRSKINISPACPTTLPTPIPSISEYEIRAISLSVFNTRLHPEPRIRPHSGVRSKQIFGRESCATSNVCVFMVSLLA